jgi:hypothetical protein
MGLDIFTSCTSGWIATGSSMDLMTVAQRRLTKKQLKNIRLKMSKTKMPSKIFLLSLWEVLVYLLCDTQVNLRGRWAMT